MQLMDELVEAYLDNNIEHLYFLDFKTGQVILYLEEEILEDPGIEWDDEENEERYIGIPKIKSNEAYSLMTQFAKRTESDPELKLFDALNGYKPFGRFKDVLYELNAWGEWNEFERHYAEEEIKDWMERFDLSYEQLVEIYKGNQP